MSPDHSSLWLWSPVLRTLFPVPAHAVEVLTTGGTFDTLTDGSIGPPQAEAVLHAARVTHEAWRSRELMRIDSSDMDDSHRRHIREAVLASAYTRIILIHGTDTLLQTAGELSDVRDKVVVLTGSFTPASAPQGDAAFNLGAALLAVQLLPVGVHLVIGGEWLRPGQVRKDPIT